MRKFERIPDNHEIPLEAAADGYEESSSENKKSEDTDGKLRSERSYLKLVRDEEIPLNEKSPEDLLKEAQENPEISTIGQKTVDELLEEGRNINGPRYIPKEPETIEEIDPHDELASPEAGAINPTVTENGSIEQKSIEELLADSQRINSQPVRKPGRAGGGENIGTARRPRAAEATPVSEESQQAENPWQSTGKSWEEAAADSLAERAEQQREAASETPEAVEAEAIKERTLTDLAKEAKEIVQGRAKSRWEKFKGSIAEKVGWVKDKVGDMKIGAEMILEDVNNKLNNLSERGIHAMENLAKSTKEATDEFTKATINLGLKAWDHAILSHKEDRLQKKHLKAKIAVEKAEEKVRKQRGKIDRAFFFKGKKERKLATLELDLEEKREILNLLAEDLNTVRTKRKKIDDRVGRERLAEQPI